MKLSDTDQLILAQITKRGLNRYEAARYIGIGETMFDDLVREGSCCGLCASATGNLGHSRLDLALDR